MMLQVSITLNLIQLVDDPKKVYSIYNEFVNRTFSKIKKAPNWEPFL